MSETHSDALVFFGATGDLAHKKIFPSLQSMVKRGHLDVPVIGVAKAGWNLERLKARADTRPLRDLHLVGTPAQVTEALQGVVRQGAHRLTVNFGDVPHPEGTWLFAAAVLPHL